MPTTRRPGGTPKTLRPTAPSRAGGNTSDRPAATRPAAAARGRRPAEELRTPRSIKGLAILASIFVMLAITLIPAVRATLNQQGQINELRDRLVQQRGNVAALQQEQRQWNDPAYVEQQARERLKFVRVGERSYTVIDGQAGPALAGGQKIAAPSKVAAVNVPWYGQLWQSIVIADNPAGAAAADKRLPAPLKPHD